MPVEPVELEAFGQEGGSYFSKFLLFFFIIFHIGACNSPDKLLTIYVPNNPKNSYMSFTFYTQSQEHGII